MANGTATVESFTVEETPSGGTTLNIAITIILTETAKNTPTSLLFFNEGGVTMLNMGLI